MTHIYLFNMRSPGSAGGIGTYLEQMVCFLRNMENISLNVVHYNADVPNFSICEEQGYRIFKFPVPPEKTIYIRDIWYVLYPFIQIKENDNLIFHFNYYQDAYLIPYIKKKFPNSKTVFTIHYSEWGLLLEGNTSYFKDIIRSESATKNETEQFVADIFKRDKEVYDSVDHIISLCEYTRNILIEEYRIAPEKISLIRNGLKDELTDYSDYDRENIRKEWNISSEEKVILYAGRVEKAKGIDSLIEAFRLLLKKYSSIRLLIAGEGDFSEFLLQARKLSSKVSFVGRLDKTELYDLYRIADLGVVPSKNEQCNYVVIEMMMFNIPLVLSSTSGLKEMSQSAIIVQAIEEDGMAVVSPIKLAEAIDMQLISPRKGVRIEYEQNYTLKKMAHNMLNLYHSLFEKKPISRL